MAGVPYGAHRESAPIFAAIKAENNLSSKLPAEFTKAYSIESRTD